MALNIKTLFALTISIIATSCAGNKEKAEAVNDSLNSDVVAAANIKGQWYLENITLGDSVAIRPMEAVPGSKQYIIFEDSTYSITTNCNTFSGAYTLKGNSIKLGDGAMTEIACDNMVTEDALRKILPDVTTVYVKDNQTVRLECQNKADFIEIRRAMPDYNDEPQTTRK